MLFRSCAGGTIAPRSGRRRLLSQIRWRTGPIDGGPMMTKQVRPRTLRRRARQRNAAGASRVSAITALGVVRMLLGLGLVGMWMQSGLPGSWTAWNAALNTPSAAEVSYDAQRATLSQGPNVLLAAAREQCEPLPPVIVVSDDPASPQLGKYLLYPRRFDLITAGDALEIVDLDTHAGGCVLSFGSARERLQPFMPRLARMTCARGDCLYRVREASGTTVR